MFEADQAGAERRAVQAHLAEAELHAVDGRIEDHRQNEDEAREQQQIHPIARLGELTDPRHWIVALPPPRLTADQGGLTCQESHRFQH